MFERRAASLCQINQTVDTQYDNHFKKRPRSAVQTAQLNVEMARTVDVDSRNPKNYQFHMKIDPTQNFKPFLQKGTGRKFLADSLENSQLGCLESKRQVV